MVFNNRMSRARCRNWLTLLACTAVLGLAVPCAAQASADELARRHFDSGAAYLDQSEYESALREFQKAHELSGRPEILINIATVYERLGRLEEAVQALKDYLQKAPEGAHAETVGIRIKNLEDRIEKQKADKAAEPPPTGAAPPEAAPSTPTPAPAPAAAPPPAADEQAEPSRIPAYVLFGVGSVAAAGAVLTGLLANGEYNDAEDSCSPNCSDDDVSTGRTLALTSTILTGVAVVSAAVGAVLFFGSSPDEQARSARPSVAVGIAPGAAAAQARWRF